jgi:ppGpp synthetase/RelA/SpoT-type nucleotidyltranferase
MADHSVARGIVREIEACVSHYEAQIPEFMNLAKTVHLNLSENAVLAKLIHSSKFRTKDLDKLRGKLLRFALRAKKEKKAFAITPANLFKQINDLAGVRLLHLHTKQMVLIHPTILAVLAEHKYEIIGKPVAYTWDLEYQLFYKSLGLRTVLRPSLYTSVHYDIRANRRTEMRCELQVRSLAEELWGEVSHLIDYPEECDSPECKEQIAVLARVASGCTRLVDSIFVAFDEHKKRKKVV